MSLIPPLTNKPYLQLYSNTAATEIGPVKRAAVEEKQLPSIAAVAVGAASQRGPAVVTPHPSHSTGSSCFPALLHRCAQGCCLLLHSRLLIRISILPPFSFHPPHIHTHTVARPGYILQYPRKSYPACSWLLRPQSRYQAVSTPERETLFCFA